MPFVDLRYWEPFRSCPSCTKEKWKKIEVFVESFNNISLKLNFKHLVKTHETVCFQSTYPFTRQMSFQRCRYNIKSEFHYNYPDAGEMSLINYYTGVKKAIVNGRVSKNARFIQVPITNLIH